VSLSVSVSSSALSSASASTSFSLHNANHDCLRQCFGPFYRFNLTESLHGVTLRNACICDGMRRTEMCAFYDRSDGPLHTSAALYTIPVRSATPI
jgi:hypothetical protein